MQHAIWFNRIKFLTVWKWEKQIRYLRVGVFKCTIWSHVLDDISQNGIHLSFLRGENKPVLDTERQSLFFWWQGQITSEYITHLPGNSFKYSAGNSIRGEIPPVSQPWRELLLHQVRTKTLFSKVLGCYSFPWMLVKSAVPLSACLSRLFPRHWQEHRGIVGSAQSQPLRAERPWCSLHSCHLYQGSANHSPNSALCLFLYSPRTESDFYIQTKEYFMTQIMRLKFQCA